MIEQILLLVSLFHHERQNLQDSRFRQLVNFNKLGGATALPKHLNPAESMPPDMPEVSAVEEKASTAPVSHIILPPGQHARNAQAPNFFRFRASPRERSRCTLSFCLVEIKYNSGGNPRSIALARLLPVFVPAAG